MADKTVKVQIPSQLPIHCPKCGTRYASFLLQSKYNLDGIMPEEPCKICEEAKTHDILEMIKKGDITLTKLRYQLKKLGYSVSKDDIVRYIHKQQQLQAQVFEKHIDGKIFFRMKDNPCFKGYNGHRGSSRIEIKSISTISSRST